MKNAMKKLMSVLLVAVLLISAIPFAASADGDEFDFTGVDVQSVGRSVDNGETSFASVQSTAGETKAQGKTQVVLTLDGKEYYNDWENIAEGTTIRKLLVQLVGADTTNNLFAKYECDAGWDSQIAGWNSTKVAFNFTIRKCSVDVGINGGTLKAYKSVNYGSTITLNKDLVIDAGLSLGADYEIASFQVNGSSYKVGATVTVTGYTKIEAVLKSADSSSTTTPTNPTTSATYVDVILVTNKTSGFTTGEYYRCNLVNGKIKQADRDAIAKLIEGKNIVAWKRTDNDTQASTLLNFDFSGLANPINIMPVVGTNNSGNGSNNGSTTDTSKQYTVTFYDYDGKTVLHTAKTTNGKITYVDANYAALQVSSVSGYTFAERWKKNGSGESIATSTIVSELTFTADTYFTPVYNKTSSSTVTSSKNLNDIILNIFVNEDFSSPAKTIKLNTSFPAVLDDDTISLTEIKNSVVATYYSAKDTTKGLLVDGMYYTTGSFMYNWLTDNEATKTSTISGVAAKRAEGTVCINVMVTNAVAKSTTSTADSSNPKTGDSIYTAMTVMGISAASLAAVMYIYNKKRQAI